jgi:hypothetical protein
VFVTPGSKPGRRYVSDLMDQYSDIQPYRLADIPTKEGCSLLTSLGTSPTAANVQNGVLLTSGGQTSGFAWLATAPNPPFTLTMLAIGLENNQAMIGWSDGTKCQFLYATSTQLLVQNNLTVNAFASNAAALTIDSSYQLWRGAKRITDNGTTVTFQVSTDGRRWQTVYSVAKASGYLGASGYTKISVGCHGGASLQSMLIAGWKIEPF